MAIRMPDDHVFVAALTNNVGSDTQYFFRIVACALGQPIEEPTPVELSPEVLGRYAGDYQSQVMGKWKIALEDHRLLAVPEFGPQIELVPFSATEFFCKARSLDHLKFVRNADAVVTCFEFQGAIGKPQIFMKVVL